MVRASPEHGSGTPKRLTFGFLLSISAFMTRFAKQAGHFSAKPRMKNGNRNPKPIRNNKEYFHSSSSNTSSIHPSPKSPLSARPKQFITSISNKAIAFIHGKRIGYDKDDAFFGGSYDEFGDGGVWQRAILMGDKCQPLDFSGVIYYDSNGKQLDDVPLRSPRASPLPGYFARRQEV